jgi:hypothetical protein
MVRKPFLERLKNLQTTSKYADVKEVKAKIFVIMESLKFKPNSVNIFIRETENSFRAMRLKMFCAVE